MRECFLAGGCGVNERLAGHRHEEIDDFEMKKIAHRLEVISLLLFLATCPAWGRALPQWPYQKLWDTSDVVAVLEPLGTENNNDGPGDSKLTDVQGVTTRFKVSAIFKGEKVAVAI